MRDGVNRIEKVYGSFGIIWRLLDGNVIVDTYCPWNGDARPDWMDAGLPIEELTDEGREGSGS